MIDDNTKKTMDELAYKAAQILVKGGAARIVNLGETNHYIVEDDHYDLPFLKLLQNALGFDPSGYGPPSDIKHNDDGSTSWSSNGESDSDFGAMSY